MIRLSLTIECVDSPDERWNLTQLVAYAQARVAELAKVPFPSKLEDHLLDINGEQYGHLTIERKPDLP